MNLSESRSLWVGISRRDRAILASIVRGDSNKAIANEFDLTEPTVKMLLRRLFPRIGVANRTQAATWALANGLAAPADSGLRSGK